MNTYEKEIRKGIKSGFDWQVVWSDNSFRTGHTNIEAKAEAAVVIAIEEMEALDAEIALEDDDDYGLTNEQGMGWGSAEEKEEFEAQPAKETQFVDDGFAGEIVVKKVEQKVEKTMNVSITQVSETDCTEEMPIGNFVEIDSIEALAKATDAVVKKASDSTYILTCEWGNGEGEDIFKVEIR